MAKSAGIHYIYLYDLFSASEPESLYFTYGDDHWNGAGQALADQAMLDNMNDETI